MKIIWLTPEIPYPPIGGRNGVYNRIVQLSASNDIYLCSVVYHEKEKECRQHLLNFCKEVYFFNRAKQKLWRFIKSLFFPYSVATRTFHSMRKTIRQIINNENIDCIIIDFPNMARNLIKLKKNAPPIYLHQHNIEYKRMRELGSVKTLSKIKRIAYYFESFRLERYESTLYKKRIFRAVTFFSTDDESFFRRRWEKFPVDTMTIPLGANDPHVVSVVQKNRTFLFVGRLDEIAVPNVEASIWFATKIFPIILQEVPDAKFIIAGANPSKRVLSLQTECITVISNFKTVDEIYSLADYVVVPLLSGGGVKGKLIEAIAHRKLVITTDRGIEGTEFKDHEHVILAKSESDFAKYCIKIIMHPEIYNQIERQAYELFQRLYSWETIGKKYMDFLIEENKC